MNAKELRAKTKNELADLLISCHQERFNLKMQKGTGQLAKPDQVKSIRKDIARINTILGEKEHSDE